MKRYALLDTDFISKTYSVQDDGGNHLIDRVMELPEYEFFCHAQIVTELNRYNADAPIWLSENIGAQKIKSYTDIPCRWPAPTHQSGCGQCCLSDRG